MGGRVADITQQHSRRSCLKPLLVRSCVAPLKSSLAGEGQGGREQGAAELRDSLLRQRRGKARSRGCMGGSELLVHVLATVNFH